MALLRVPNYVRMRLCALIVCARARTRARALCVCLCVRARTHTHACVCRYYRQNRIERFVNTPQLLRLDTFVDIVCQQFLGREAIEYLGGDEPNFPSADNACYIRFQNLTYLWSRVQC